MVDYTDRAYALGSPQEIKRRLAMLSEPHIAPLADHVADWRRRYPPPDWEFPDFDPLDGG